MELEKKIITFIKAINKDFFDRFIDYGEICLNTVKWFREYEKIDSNIGDGFEGVSFACGHSFEIKIGNPITNYNSEEELNQKLSNLEWIDLGKGNNLKAIDESINANIFSLYTVFSKNDRKYEGPLVPQKFIDEFSNHRFVIFLNPVDFISKVENVFKEYKREIKRGLVKYYELNEELVEDLYFFNKPNKYSYQKEFRIVVEDSNAEMKIIRIGSLKEICYEIDVKKDYIIELNNNDYFSIRQKD